MSLTCESHSRPQTALTNAVRMPTSTHKLRISDKRYADPWQHTTPGVTPCTELVACIQTTPLFSDFKLVRPKGHAVLTIPKTRTTESYESFTTCTKKRSRSRDFTATKPPDEIVHIRYSYCLLMASRLFVFVSGGQGKCRCVPRNASWPDRLTAEPNT